MKRNNWKRLFALGLSLVMLASFVGCGSKEQQAADSEQETKTDDNSGSEKETVTTDPITISILTTRTFSDTNDPNDLWIFNYLEYWLAEQGYNVTLEVEQTLEADEKIPLLLGTDSLPDVVWGIDLSSKNAVQYGVDEGMLLDWTPYLNEETMPNLVETFEKVPDALSGSIAPDGSIYGIPYVTSRYWHSDTGHNASSQHVYIDSSWLEQCGLENPATMEDFLEMLRTFKKEIKIDGKEVVPLASTGGCFEQSLWSSLGYYGGYPDVYGTGFEIKDGEVYLPAATDDYRTYVEYMNTLYTEGLISPDYYTMDDTTSEAMMVEGICGAIGSGEASATNSMDNQAEWISVLPMTLGDNDEVVATAAKVYKVNKIWASAKTEHPEIIAKIVDYLFSYEGGAYYFYGPAEGEDPLNMVDGYYLDENLIMTTKLIEDGEYTDWWDYAMEYILPTLGTTSGLIANGYYEDLQGNTSMRTFTDAITGDTVEDVYNGTVSEDTAWGITQLSKIEAWENNLTTVNLPSVYLSEDDELRASELKQVLNTYIDSESAKFITGLRSLDELDDYFAELEALGVDEYVEIYRNAYSAYMESVFN